ncbi:DUF6916 family protein [Cellulomonas soli]|uniref:DUF6916 family protein n=1 Tax=Cellulomonas soli TaxID=931535 RepID=UPI003F87552B
MLTRRTVLVAGAGAVAVGTVGTAVGRAVLRGRPDTLPLDLTALSALVGTRFLVDGTHPVTLTTIAGSRGDNPRAEAFTLAFDGDPSTHEVPAGIHTLRHAEGELVLALGPVGAEGTRLEAVVNRTRS